MVIRRKQRLNGGKVTLLAAPKPGPAIVLQQQSANWPGFWLRAMVTAWHVSVLALFSPFDRAR